MKLSRPVLIVGGGIAGQTLGCALAQRGIACEIVEIKPDWDIAGAGMYVQGNALRAFGDIGIVEAIVAGGWHARDDLSHIADHNGVLLARTRFPRLAGPGVPAVVAIRRQRLHDILNAAVRRAGVPVRMGTTIAALRAGEAFVHVGFSDGTEGNYDLVVGSDGIRSKVRDLVFGGVDPTFTGFSNWRVILPRPGGLERTTWMMGPGKSFGLIPISDDRIYIGGVTKEPGNPWFERNALADLLHARFADFGGLAAEALALVDGPGDVIYTPIEEVLMPQPWHRGRIILVGDAAHASSPFWAQGASMAVEDVIVLARLLDEHDGTVGEVMRRWSERRVPRCLFVQQGSLQTGLRSHDESTGAHDRLCAFLRANAQAEVDRRYSRLAEEI